MSLEPSERAQIHGFVTPLSLVAAEVSNSANENHAISSLLPGILFLFANHNCRSVGVTDCGALYFTSCCRTWHCTVLELSVELVTNYRFGCWVSARAVVFATGRHLWNQLGSTSAVGKRFVAGVEPPGANLPN